MAPAAVAALLAGAYVAAAPCSPDLAAHVFRSELFGREGFTVWNGLWYGGHHTPVYSVLAPPLMWLLGPQLAGALSAVAATALFEPLARRAFGPRAGTAAALLFGLGSATLLATGRLTFALGVGFGIGALLALQRGRPALAGAVGVLCALGSPLAGVFLCLCGVAYALGVASGRGRGLVLAACALLPTLALTAAFPEGGYTGFPGYLFLPILAPALAFVIVLPRRESVLRWGAALYAVGIVITYYVPTPVGGNADRLSQLAAPALLAGALGSRLTRGAAAVPLALLLAALLGWQWWPAARDLGKSSDPASHASYYETPRAWLESLPVAGRVEVPFTAAKREAAELARARPLARGWFRPLDIDRHPIFYRHEGGILNPAGYARWLASNGVSHVAVPDAKLDDAAVRERELIDRGLPYLRLVRRSRHWRLFEVLSPDAMVTPEAPAAMSLVRIASDELLLRVRRPGRALVRVRWTPYWLAHGGCVEPAGDWTRVRALVPGHLRLTIRFSPERIRARSRRCDGVAEP